MNNRISASSDFEFIELICKEIQQNAIRHVDEKSSFSLVLSGGNTPGKIFNLLKERYINRIPWEKIHFFWVDERCVSPNNKDSNYGLAYTHLLKDLNKVGSINRIQGETDPAEARVNYAETIKEYFCKTHSSSFDFMLLGMGKDGHVASLFPHQEIDDNELVVCTQNPYNKSNRISLSYAVINQSKMNLLMMNGKQKYEVFTKNDNLPIHKVRIDTTIVYI